MTVLLVALAAAAVISLAVITRLARDPWGPDADRPIDYRLTDTGRDAATHPTDYVLDEDNETWGPA